MQRLVILLRFLLLIVEIRGFENRSPRIRQRLTQLCDVSAQQALERTKAQLQRLQNQGKPKKADPLDAERELLTQEYLLQSANSLKILLKERKLPRNGRKPDLAKRLADADLTQKYSTENQEESLIAQVVESMPEFEGNGDSSDCLESFAGLPLSQAAGVALANAQFNKPSPIQAAVLPRLFNGESLIMHAATGSGKVRVENFTCCILSVLFLIFPTQRLWLMSYLSQNNCGNWIKRQRTLGCT